MAVIFPRAESAGAPADAHESKIPSIVICNTILMVASTLGTAVRVFVRVRYMNIGWDDIFCIIGWVFTFLECLVCILMTRYGYGKHIDTIPDTETLGMFLKLDFVTELAYVVAFGAIKISFSLFYLKIFPGKWFKIACWCVIGVILGETASDFFVVIFQCSPVQKAWDATQTLPGKCLQLLTFYYITFAVRLATDVALIALPIPKLLKLKMSNKKRAGLIVMFGLGGLVTVAGIIRATYLNDFSIDHTWSLVDTLNWSSVELGLGVFIACVPSFKAWIKFCFPGLHSKLGFTSNKSYGARYEMYGYGSSARRATRPDDRKSWRRSTVGKGKMTSSTQTQTDVATSRSGSEERIISQPPGGIQVTTDVSVDQGDDRPEHPVDNPHWPLER